MKFFALLLSLFCFSTAYAQLTNTQQLQLANGLKSETTPPVVAALLIRDDVTLTTFCNAVTTTPVWNESQDSKALVDAAPLTLYDGLTQGKRDEWRLLLDYNTSMDMRFAAKRNVIVDAWGTASRSVPILQAGLRMATHCELYFGVASVATTNTVSGSLLNLPGQVGQVDLSAALNANP